MPHSRARLRPDDAALLYLKGNSQIQENVIAGGTSDQLVEAGKQAWYDSTGNIVLVQQFLPYPALVVTSRGSFGSSKPLGTPGLAGSLCQRERLRSRRRHSRRRADHRHSANEPAPGARERAGAGPVVLSFSQRIAAAAHLAEREGGGGTLTNRST